jgi:hypothetical protein
MSSPSSHQMSSALDFRSPLTAMAVPTSSLGPRRGAR